jgi:hypothetical protein
VRIVQISENASFTAYIRTHEASITHRKAFGPGREVLMMQTIRKLIRLPQPKATRKMPSGPRSARVNLISPPGEVGENQTKCNGKKPINPTVSAACPPPADRPNAGGCFAALWRGCRGRGALTGWSLKWAGSDLQLVETPQKHFGPATAPDPSSQTSPARRAHFLTRRHGRALVL